MNTDPMRATDFLRQLRTAVPEMTPFVDAHLEEYGELLLHVLLSDLRRELWERFQTSDVDVVRRGLTLLDHALVTGDDTVANAVALSFVEGGDWHDPATRPFFDCWPPELQAELERQRTWEP